MTHLKTLAAAAAVIGGLGLASASAAPLAPVSADAVAGPTRVTEVAFGCGPGFAPGRFGRCRPVFRSFRGYGHGPRRFYDGPRRSYGPRRFYR